MNRFKTLAATTALTMMVGLAALCPAQTGPAMPPAKVPAQAESNGVLTDESLKTMLINLGYAPEEGKGADGRKLYFITATKNNTVYTLSINISPSKTKIWVQAYLCDLTADDGARALKMLELNAAVGPSHFVYFPGTKNVYLFCPMDNRAVTPKNLKDQIDSLLDSCESTKEVWNVTKPTVSNPTTPK